MRLKVLILTGLISLMTITSQAQFFDTLQVLFKKKKHIDLRLESRNSFIANNRALISGVRVGIAFERKLKIGIGVSWLASEIREDDYVMNSENTIEVVPKYLHLAYVCYYIDVVFYKTRRWQLSVPIQAGTGASWFQHERSYDLSSANKSFLLLYEPGISTQFKIFKWFGLGADIGYRFTLRNNKYVGNKLMSPTYAFKIQFWADQLFYELFPKSKITKRFGPAVW